MIRAFSHRRRARVDNWILAFRWLVGRRDFGEPLNRAKGDPCIETFGVSAAAPARSCAYKQLAKRHTGISTCFRATLGGGGDKRDDGYRAYGSEQVGSGGESPDALGTIFFRDPKIATQAPAQFIPVEHHRAVTETEQRPLKLEGQCGSARVGEAGKPENAADMATTCYALRHRDDVRP